MAQPLSCDEFRAGLSDFLNSEMKQVFENILRSEFKMFVDNPPGAFRKSPTSMDHGSEDSRVTRVTRLALPLQSQHGEPLKLSARHSHEPPVSRKSFLHTSTRQSNSTEKKSTPKIEVFSYSGKTATEQAMTRIPSVGRLSPMLKNSRTIAPLEIPLEGRDYRNLANDGYDDDALPLRESKVYQDLSNFMKVCSYLSGVMVLLNVLCVGFDTDYRITHMGASPAYTEYVEIFFCFYFVGEVALRITIFGRVFFMGDGRAWNYFDLVIVSIQVLEQCMRAFHISKHHDNNFSFLRALRALRLMRVVRLVRVFHLFDELRQIVDSMVNSCTVLMWSIVVLLLVIYLFSIVFLQCILDAGHMEKMTQQDELHHFFGSLARTIFTMFECVAGGVNWDDVVTPLMREISPYLGIVFSVYVASSIFAIMNMLTGVFVDRAMSCVKKDREDAETHQIRGVFPMGLKVDREVFTDAMESQVMQRYLADLGITMNEVDGLFDLIDEGCIGTLSPQEAAEGCLRLRGPARALDLAIILREIGFIRNEIWLSRSHSPRP